MDLVVRLPNWVGDVCMSLPALDALRQSGLRLHLVGRGWAPDLLAEYPATVTGLPKGLLKAARRVDSLPGESMLLMPRSLSSAVMARLGGKRALGVAADGRSLFLHRRLPPLAGVHESVRLWALARAAVRALGLPDHAFADDVPRPVLPLGKAVIENADQTIAALRRPCVVLCPMATGTIDGQPKRWPGFAELAQRLHAVDVAVLCCPGPGEEDECAALLPQAMQLKGLRLGAYAALMRRVDLVVANDSGPMHLAAAAQGRVLGIFGVSDPQKFGPCGGVSMGRPGRWPEVAEVFARTQELLQAAPLAWTPEG